MKLNKLIPIGIVSMAIIAGFLMRPAQAEQGPKLHKAAMLVLGEGQGNGLYVYASSVSEGLQAIPQGTPAAQAMADLLNQGVPLNKSDGVIYTFSN